MGRCGFVCIVMTIIWMSLAPVTMRFDDGNLRKFSFATPSHIVERQADFFRSLFFGDWRKTNSTVLSAWNALKKNEKNEQQSKKR